MRKAAAVPLGLLVAVAATGWLYVFRPSLPGPSLGEALPLDELAKHASTPLVWYVAVWAAAGALLGAMLRWARVERLTAALLLALAIGLWTYLAEGVSLAVVRQIPASDALDVAARVHAVYVAAAVAGLSGAIVAAPRRRGDRRSTVLAWAVGAAGCLNVLHAALPGGDDGLLRSLTPDAVGPLARAAAVLTGIALLVASRGLARRRRRAWTVAVSVAALSTTLHVLHGLNDGTLVSALVLLALVGCRDEFDGPGDTSSRWIALGRAAIAGGTILSYGATALWLNRMVADQPYTAPFALREIVAGTLGLNVRGSPHLAGAFGDWFPLSLLLLGVSGTAWVVAGFVAPWRHRVRQAEHECELAHRLVGAWGVDTLAPFTLRADKSYFFGESEQAFLAYRVVGGVAIVSGDPIGACDDLDPLLSAFVALARRRDCRISILGASEGRLDLYRRHGLHALYHGDEAIVDVASFSLEGRAIRKVRQSVHRLESAGYTARVYRPSELGAQLRTELQEIADTWRGVEAERGFAMALDRLFSLGDDDAVFLVGFDAAGRAGGFLHFAVARAGNALSLSSMPRLRSTPNGFNEWLICEAIAWARAHGFERVSLNFSPFAELIGSDAKLTTLQELQRRALLRMKGRFQLDNLLVFNRKFFPHWERRFVVYERRLDLPRVGIAALAAEAYLPFQGERR